jgi:HAD superfamily hydrolase (TIGR01459 family)
MTPIILKNAGPLLTRYEAIFCDVWGVLHDGRQAYQPAGEALARFRLLGGTVILVSNAPVPADGVEQVLARTGVRRDAWDAIVSSGDIALAHISEKGYRRMHWVGPSERDYKLYLRLQQPQAQLADADAIVCTGLRDDRHETVADYRWLIEAGVRRQLPFVCANPDLVVDVGPLRLPCAGSIAAEYERLGGQVFWAGKPHPVAYATAVQRAGERRGAAPALSRILAIGDALRTDMAAARGLGVAGLFIAAGIHSDDLLEGGEIDPARLGKLLASADGSAAVAAMPELRW